MATAAKVKQGERPKRQKGQAVQDKPGLQAQPRRKPKTAKQCFENPLLKVDVKTGETYVHRLREHWNGEREANPKETSSSISAVTGKIKRSEAEMSA
jgi:hypothetical protein